MKKTPDQIHLQPSHVQAYNFIRKYIGKNVVSPEVNEIAKGIKLTERHTHRVLGDLVSLGYVSREPYKKRSIKIERPLK